ncbi:YetF domain-containing protein [Dyella sp. KRB-257]|uniref:YetF domain-containing protein n=1 Tax=Dyella sp. KRB-257 TaxID=3400915 RepID=UPI003C0DD044
MQDCSAVLVRDGIVDWREQVRRHVSCEDFQVGKRAADCRSDEAIELALLETSGSITILKKRSG